MIINFRCKLHKDGILDSCKIYTNNNETVECEEHVFDKSVYWGVTLNEQVSKTVYTIGIHTYISTKFF